MQLAQLEICACSHLQVVITFTYKVTSIKAVAKTGLVAICPQYRGVMLLKAIDNHQMVLTTLRSYYSTMIDE